MNPERLRQIEELYHAAREDRAALDKADPELRREVESLLAQDGVSLPTLNLVSDSTVTQLAVGAQLGPYKIEARIGAGGMGEVYRAADTRLDRKVAIKICAQQFSGRFEREARAISALNHPHICTLYDVGPNYLVTEFVDGGTLRDWCREPRTWRQIVELLVGVADGLAAAHDASILHRDIKPANILVSKSGYAKLADFGLAKLLGPGQSGITRTLTEGYTRPGIVLGTIPYMSPEQASGEPLDARSDIFSFAVVLYEALSGERPFRGATDLEVLQTIIHGAPQPLRGDIPEALRGTIEKALEKDPAGRYQFMREMVVDLRRQARAADPLRQEPVRSFPRRLSVAVLPFRLLTPDPEHQFLSAALADAVVNRLGATGKLLVRPTASMMRYAQSPTEWNVAAREMNVDLVVEANIQKMGPRLRVLVAAHRASDAVTLHSSKHDGTMDDLFGLQDQIAEAVSSTLVPQPPKPAEAAGPPTRNALAYELYLRAADRISRYNKWDTQTAIEMLTSATVLDPNFAGAWAHLAQACIQMGVTFDSDPRWLAQAETAVAKSLDLDQANADAFCARGQLLWTPSCGYQNRPALRALNAALKINPGFPQAQVWRGLILCHLGLYEEARRGLEEADAANPGDGFTLLCLGQTCQYRGDYEEAYDFTARALRADPVAVLPNIFFPTIVAYMGRHSEAIEKIRVGRQIQPEEPIFLSVEGIIAARDGRFARAEELADRALQSKQTLIHSHHLWHSASAVYAMCGKPEKAMPLLHRCAEMGLPNYLLFHGDPHLRGLHNRPEFLDLMTTLRREHEQYSQEFGVS